MAVLEKLEPQSVFYYFEELCSIPHGSFHTKKVSDWLVGFAKSHHLEYIQDESNNVIIFKAAATGYETAEPVIMQGHMDMVCEKAADCTKNMETEGLDLMIDGDIIRARGTTLGGDDGIAVAMMLAVLAAENLPHPALECVFTVDEEVGMLGAMSIDLSRLKGRRMINMDTEEEGTLTVSCAGGNVTRCVLPIRREAFSGTGYSVTITGLVGGHSGVEIDKGRANANVLMGRLLTTMHEATDMRLVSVCGGQKDNAITRECVAEFVATDAQIVKRVCDEMGAALRNEYAVTDKDVSIQWKACTTAMPLTAESTNRVLCLLTCAPNGIQSMSANIEGLVQTSLNMGILITTDTTVEASFGVRSSVATQLTMLVQRLRCLTEALGGTVEVSGSYPGWQYRQDSPLRDLVVGVFTEQYGHVPAIEAIHAGLECGLLSEKLPGLDCVAFGPDMREVHTCRENMSVSSVQRVYKMVVEVLKRMH